jgi:predicted RNA-binding Zn-ribbon protein involved in translation (DUF1610 family)
MEYLFFGVALVLWLAWGVRQSRRVACPDCGWEMKLEDVEDPWGIKVGRTSGIFLKGYSRRARFRYRCPICGRAREIANAGS